jgi:hypothetical protein
MRILKRELHRHCGCKVARPAHGTLSVLAAGTSKEEEKRDFIAQRARDGAEVSHQFEMTGGAW